MIKQILIASVIVLASCRQHNNTDGRGADKTTATKTQNALKFINDYVVYVNETMGKDANDTGWVNSSKLVTNSFKNEMKQIIDDGYKKEPIVGIDEDPVFDAQYYPQKGFVLDTFDARTNYLIVRGKAEPEYKLAMKVVEVNGIWLVDGCGIINVPVRERVKR